MGFTDGDGTFGISRRTTNTYGYNYTISQSNYNRVTLDYIHNVLRVGNVTTYGVGRTMSRLQVQDRLSLTVAAR